MPYKIFHAHHGFFVADKGQRFSKHPLTKSDAIKQREAIAISEAKKHHRSPSHYFSK